MHGPRSKEEIVAEFGWQLSSVGAADDPLDCAAELLAQLIPSAGISHGRLDIDRGAVSNRVWPPAAFQLDDMHARLISSYRDHPMIATFLPGNDPANGAPRRTSDVISLSRLRKTSAYALILKPLGWRNQLAILTERSGGSAGSEWLFERGTSEFTDDEVELAAALQPVLTVFERFRAHEDAGPTPSPDGDALTRRELDVLSQAARGLTAYQIAHELRIAVGTVNKHLENAYRKLGASSRIDAVERARSRGELPYHSSQHGPLQMTTPFSRKQTQHGS